MHGGGMIGDACVPSAMSQQSAVGRQSATGEGAVETRIACLFRRQAWSISVLASIVGGAKLKQA